MKELSTERKQQMIDLLIEKSDEELLYLVESTKKLMSYYRCAPLQWNHGPIWNTT